MKKIIEFPLLQWPSSTRSACFPSWVPKLVGCLLTGHTRQWTRCSWFTLRSCLAKIYEFLPILKISIQGFTLVSCINKRRFTHAKHAITDPHVKRDLYKVSTPVKRWSRKKIPTFNEMIRELLPSFKYGKTRLISDYLKNVENFVKIILLKVRKLLETGTIGGNLSRSGKKLLQNDLKMA